MHSMAEKQTTHSVGKLQFEHSDEQHEWFQNMHSMAEKQTTHSVGKPQFEHSDEQHEWFENINCMAEKQTTRSIGKPQLEHPDEQHECDVPTVTCAEERKSFIVRKPQSAYPEQLIQHGLPNLHGIPEQRTPCCVGVPRPSELISDMKFNNPLFGRPRAEVIAAYMLLRLQCSVIHHHTSAERSPAGPQKVTSSYVPASILSISHSSATPLKSTKVTLWPKVRCYTPAPHHIRYGSSLASCSQAANNTDPRQMTGVRTRLQSVLRRRNSDTVRMSLLHRLRPRPHH